VSICSDSQGIGFLCRYHQKPEAVAFFRSELVLSDLCYQIAKVERMPTLDLRLPGMPQWQSFEHKAISKAIYQEYRLSLALVYFVRLGPNYDCSNERLLHSLHQRPLYKLVW
jgi:hypothetical protein